ncbi:MAG TPA: carbohydrate ABC transporter permease [Devosiaceae bacterium]|jgi:ABC-type glycerol-3-phosphate transport system permease component
MSTIAPYEKGHWGTRLLINVVTVVVGLVWILPFLWMLSTALKTKPEIFHFPPQWLPNSLYLGNFTAAFEAAPFGLYYLNSFIIAAVTTVLTVLAASMAGYAMARLPYRGSNVVIAGLLATTMIPFQVLLIPFFITMTALHLVNTLPGLILAYLAIFLPFAIFMFRAYFADMPREVEESARMDGSSWFGVYWRIAMPMARPAVAAVAIYTFIESWNEYFIALTMTSSDERRTLPVGLAAFLNQSAGIDWGQLMASSVAASVPAVIVFLIMQRQIIAGLTGGAVKG